MNTKKSSRMAGLLLGLKSGQVRMIYEDVPLEEEFLSCGGKSVKLILKSDYLVEDVPDDISSAKNPKIYSNEVLKTSEESWILKILPVSVRRSAQ